jgi:outer membrane protein OmpA-like peptidoglycan-associated protein
MGLSFARAVTLATELMRLGIPASRLRWQGLGQEHVLDPIDPKNARVNRIAFIEPK